MIVYPSVTDRDHAHAADAADPLASFRERFVFTAADAQRRYLDGNSLGRLPIATRDAIAAHTADWGARLVSGWPDWIEEPLRAGDALAEHVLGAAPGTVVVCDSVTVNLFKLAGAAIAGRAGAIVTDEANFPTDRYVLGALGRELRFTARTPDAVTSLTGDVALVSFGLVDYRTGELADVPGIEEAAKGIGARVLWDLSHAAGVVETELDRNGIDLAVGCTYKHLNAGPGAPAFLYARDSESLTSALPGWFGQEDQFAMERPYAAAPGIARFLAGTPPIGGLIAVRTGAQLVGEAGIGAIAAKRRALTQRIVDLHDAWLAPLGFTLGSPRDPAKRGAHVALHHPDAWRVCRALVEHADVVPDFRSPDVVRLGVSPLYQSHAELHDAMVRLRDLVGDGVHETLGIDRRKVT